MSRLGRFLDHHVLANLVFVLVTVLGVGSYLELPRARDPEINFNWVSIITFFPGASARDVERRVTEPLEQAIERGVSDIRFVSSTSREGTSSILIRFEQIDERTFDKRTADVRREVQNAYTDELPAEVETPPRVLELTTSSAFPIAMVVVTGPGDDENLRRQARNVKRDLERLPGVDQITALEIAKPELQVAFVPERLVGLGITPADLTDTVRAYFRDVSAGDVETAGGQWVVRLAGTDNDPERLARLPVTTARGVVELGSIAQIRRGAAERTARVRYRGEPAVLLWATKESDANVLDLVARVRGYAQARRALRAETGVDVLLVDDQTVDTRRAITRMQGNAAIGLTLVLLVTWLFLGSRIALLISIGIPFTLAGTFLVLGVIGMSLNNAVLLGVVIALGMLVDDAVVVVESVYQRLRQGERPLAAAVAALREVCAPVTAAVLTTVAAFLPLVLLPGILGEFLQVIPIVVCTALLLSLVEAYWMLPAHVIAARVGIDRGSRIQRRRDAITRWVRRSYLRWLIRGLRRPLRTVGVVSLPFFAAIAALAFDRVKIDFFKSDPLRLFYVDVEMPPGSSLEATSEVLQEVERRARAAVRRGELRASLTFAGQQFTQTEPLFGDTIGQVMMSLRPPSPGGRDVDAIIAAVAAASRDTPAAAEVSMLRITDGPPLRRPIHLKVRGDEFSEIAAVTERLRAFVERLPGARDISTDYRPGNPELVLRHDGAAIQRTGIDPAVLNRSLLAMVDGEIAATFQDQGEDVRVRVLAAREEGTSIEALLRQTVATPRGDAVPLGELVAARRERGQQNIRHYNFRRAITLEADLDEEQLRVGEANRRIAAYWETLRADSPNIDLDFSGELDDIQESLDAIFLLFLLGVGLIYAILGTQFRSYGQPLMILVTVPLAFPGVVLGLALSGSPLSLYTMYGMVALVGIAVNAAIVLISAANDRLNAGMSPLLAVVYASRRRVIPILITSLTTMAGLFSLAAGLAGRSLIWGPVATAIVWGLGFSTVLTLFVVPLLYRAFMPRSAPKQRAG